MLNTAFQVIELALDENDKVIDRRVVPYPYATRKDAVDTIESFATRFAQSGYEPNGDFWWGMDARGKIRTRFAIERNDDSSN
jgi:hypothetical protein